MIILNRLGKTVFDNFARCWIEADHPWFEILPEEFTETDQKEEVDLTVNQLIENFQK